MKKMTANLNNFRRETLPEVYRKVDNWVPGKKDEFKTKVMFNHPGRMILKAILKGELKNE